MAGARLTRGIAGVLLAVLLSLLTAWASAAEAPIAQPSGHRVEAYFFWSEKCPHCLEARPYVEALAAELPWLTLHSLELSHHPENVDRYVRMAAELGERAESVPALIFCGEWQVGWISETITGTDLRQRLEACHLAGNVRPASPSASFPSVGDLDLRALSLPMLTLVLAGMDAFNPCAFFVLLFLLSLLVHQHHRGRMLVIGGLFVGVSGLMYFAFMAAWLNLFKMMSGLNGVTLAAGLLALFIGGVNIKDFFAFRKGLSLSIPESRKADIYQRGRRILAAGSLPAMLAATVALAIAANFYELLCTAGFPMVYTRLLTLHDLTDTGRLLYLALYTLIYILPMLAIVVAFSFSLGGRRLSERQGRLLKLLSGTMMAGLGGLLILAPEKLNSLVAAFGLMGLAVALTGLAARLTREPGR